jgi:hypothetical protein
LASALALVESQKALRVQFVTFLGHVPEPRLPLNLPVKLVSLAEQELAPAVRQLLERWAAGSANLGLARSSKAALKRLK